MANRLKKGGFINEMNLVDDPVKKMKKAKKNAETKFDSGSERDSYRAESDYEPATESQDV